MNGEWGDWLRHDGTHVPGPIGTPVRMRFINGEVDEGWIGMDRDRCIVHDRNPMGSWLWATPAGANSLAIVAYCFRQGLEDAVEELRQIVDAVLDHPAPLVDPVDAPPAPTPVELW